MSGSDSKRIEWVDILRGIGILIMVIGHVGFGGKADRLLHSYHMPLFFMVSGFLFRPKQISIGAQILHKIRTLLVPYLSFFLINYCFWLFLYQGYRNPMEPVIRALTWNTHKLPIAGALWFLTALFFTEVIYIVLSSMVKDEKARIIIILILSIGSSVFTTFSVYRLPLAIDQGIVGCGFYELGRQGAKLYRNPRFSTENMNSTKVLLAGGVFLLINLLLSFGNGYVNMKEGWYAMVPLTWVNAVMGTLGWMFISIWIFRNVPALRWYFREVGRTSIVYVGLNQLVILLTYYLPISIIGNTGSFSIVGLIGSTVSLAVSMLILYLCSLLLMNTRLKIICGK